MSTVPQLPEPRISYCEHNGCGQPIDVWDWDWTARANDDPDAAPRILCLEHAIALAPPDAQELLWLNAQRHREVRQWVGDPPGTLVAWEETIYGRSAGRETGPFPAKLFGVEVEAWDASWPQVVIQPDEDGSSLVILAGYVTIAWDIGAAWRFLWSWQRPDQLATCDLIPPDAPITHTQAGPMMDARSAFFEFRSRSGRTPGTGGRFHDREDCKQAILAAIRELRRQGQPVTQEMVGLYLIERGRRNQTSREIAGDAPADPARQVRTWCGRFGLVFAELVREA